MENNCGDENCGDEGMVLVAALVSRVEALVVSSMLEAAGIFVYVGALHHASVSVNSLALGGHRLWVPASQHIPASNVILEVLGKDEWGFSYAARRAVIRFLGFWIGLQTALYAVCIATGAFPLTAILWAPLTALSVPVNPQGRGDFFLATEAVGRGS